MGKSESSRLLYLDVLRIAAIFSVIVLHVAANYWYSVPVDSFEFAVFTFYDSLVRFCVPVLVMISGVLFLDPNREYSLQALYGKYIKRMVFIFLFWSALYAVSTNLIKYLLSNGSPRELAFTILKQFLVGHYHLWFLFMIAGLYMMVPFLRVIAHNDTLLKYFLILAIPFIYLANLLVHIPYVSDLYRVLESKAAIKLVLGYSGYFLLGFALSRIELTKTVRKVIYAFGFLGIVATFVGTVLISRTNQEAASFLFGYLTPNTLLTSVAVFVFVRSRLSGISTPPPPEKYYYLSIQDKFRNISCT